MPLKLKTTEVDIGGTKTVVAVIQDGKPVYLDGEKEVTFDAEYSAGKIAQLNREAQTHREAKETAEAALERFAGIEDPAKALEALTAVANLTSGELKTAAQVDELKAGVEKAVKANFENQIRQLETTVATITGERDGLKTNLDNEVIGGNFARSKFIAEKLILPSDAAEALFRKHFALEDGKLVAKDGTGSQIFSREKYGDPATFEEALEQLVDAYPNKAMILKGTGNSGSGAREGQGAGDGKSMPRAEFFKLSPADQMAKVQAGIQVVDN